MAGRGARAGAGAGYPARSVPILAVMTETVSAVLVQVPEAERVVSRHRARLDAAATAGVPAHVTVLFPFVPPAAITAETLAALAAAVAPVSAFDCQFGVTAWRRAGKLADRGGVSAGRLGASGGEGVDALRYDPDDHAGELVGFGRRVLAEVLLRQRPGQRFSGIPGQLDGAAELH